MVGLTKRSPSAECLFGFVQIVFEDLHFAQAIVTERVLGLLFEGFSIGEQRCLEVAREQGSVAPLQRFTERANAFDAARIATHLARSGDGLSGGVGTVHDQRSE